MTYNFTVTLADDRAVPAQSVDNLREGIERILNDAVRYPLRGQTRLLLGVCRELTVTADSPERVTIKQSTLDLLINIVQDTLNLLQCNCVSGACDGNCTHGMAREALIQMGKDK